MAAMDERTVAVVGAGLAGLYAARLLKDVVPGSVVVVEASGDLGGRVKEVDGLVPWSLQLGPEFIHGKENSVLMDLVDSWGWETKELEWPDKYYFADSKTTCTSENETEDIEKVHEFFDNILDVDEAEGASVEEIMRRRGANDAQIEIAEVCYANDFGTSLRDLGLAELKQEKSEWSYGEKYLVLDKPLSCVIDRLASGLEIWTDWQAKRIEYAGAVDGKPTLATPKGEKRCAIVNQRGEVLACDAVVLTVPLTILQDGDIEFSPPLRPEKRGAISRIAMSTATKVVLVFESQFWPESFWDACCPFGFLPEIWATKYPIRSESPSAQASARRVAIIGFVAGDRARAMSQLSKDEVVASSLAQLDEMFASRINPSPATSSFSSCYIKDWSQEPFIRGAYTFPCKARGGDRRLLAEPAGALFFAGEATHSGVNPCMQGALETGQRAMQEILESFEVAGTSKNQSKL